MFENSLFKCFITHSMCTIYICLKNNITVRSVWACIIESLTLNNEYSALDRN